MTVALGRALAAVSILALTALAVVSGLSPSSASAQANDRLEPIRTCIASERSLAVLFLVDTSGSLESTDSENLRSSAIDVLLSALADLAGNPVEDQRVAVYIDFLEFGTSVRRSFDDRGLWSQLSGDQGELPEGAYYASRNTDLDTDYAVALRPNHPSRPSGGSDAIGAIELLEQAPAGSCRLLVWFTDGQMSFVPRPGYETSWSEEPIEVRNRAAERQASEAARRLLCDGGLVDDLRGSGDSLSDGRVFVVAIGLGAERDFGFLQAVAEGQSTNGACGSRRSEVGAFLPATRNNDLVQVFAGLILEPVCSTESRCRARESFEVASSLRTFNLLVAPGSGAVDAFIEGPGDDSRTELDRERRVDLGNGAALEIRKFGEQQGGIYLIRASLPPDRASDWSGEWAVEFNSPNEETRFSLWATGDLQASMQETVPFYKGRVGEFAIELEATDGVLRPLTALTPESSLEVVAGGRVLEPTESADGEFFSYTVEIPEDFDGDELDVDINLVARVRLRDDLEPIEIGNWQQVASFEVRPAPTYPVVAEFTDLAPFDARLGAEDIASFDNAMTIVFEAPDAGSGCVGIDGVELEAMPALGSGAPVTSAWTADGTEVPIGEPCSVTIGAGDSETVEVVVSISRDQLQGLQVADDQFVGRLAGEVDVLLVGEVDPANNREAVQLTVDTELRPATKTSRDWSRFAMASVLAALVPLLLLYLYNFFVASRYQRSATIYSARVPVVISDGRLIRAGTDDDLVLSDDDLKTARPPTSIRSFDIGPLEAGERLEFSSHTSPLPFVEPQGRVRSTGGGVHLGPRGATTGMRSGVTALAISGSWLLAVPAEVADKARRDFEDTGNVGLAEAVLYTLLSSPAEVVDVGLNLRHEVTKVVADNLARFPLLEAEPDQPPDPVDQLPPDLGDDLPNDVGHPIGQAALFDEANSDSVHGRRDLTELPDE